MSRFLPFVFLTSVASLFGIAWIVVDVDPEVAPWYILALVVILIFSAIWGILGLVLYFLRTKFIKRYSVNWYIKTSFKMAFFVAFFISLVAALTVLDLISLFNLILAGASVSLFAVWSYLGKKG